MSGDVTQLDQDYLRTLLQDLEPDDFALIRATFSEDLDRIGQALAAAAAAGDPAAFARHAHRLAGAAGAVGASELQRLARHWSTAAAEADLQAALHPVAVASREARLALAALAPVPQ